MHNGSDLHPGNADLDAHLELAEFDVALCAKIMGPDGVPFEVYQIFLLNCWRPLIMLILKEDFLVLWRKL